jgi:hypothetical protein
VAVLDVQAAVIKERKMNLKEELQKATESFEVSKVLNEAEAMEINDIAKVLGTTKQNIYRVLTLGMGKMYKQIKKDFKATPAQTIKMLMAFLDADATEVIRYLDKDTKTEVEDYVRTHGAD